MLEHGSQGQARTTVRAARVYVGTSGFSYAEWKGRFYPDELPAARMLAYYAQRFSTVEMNNTFYRMPSAPVLAAWAAAVPDAFRFAIKAPRRITHTRDDDVEAPVSHLYSVITALDEHLGPVLFQLPPYARKDLPRLSRLLACVPEGQAAAFEFRHASWLDEDVLALLRARDCAWCIADVDERESPLVTTASWGYLRLRRTHYDDGALARWAAFLRQQGWPRAFVFFKHEEAGAAPAMAARLEELLS